MAHCLAKKDTVVQFKVLILGKGDILKKITRSLDKWDCLTCIIPEYTSIGMNISGADPGRGGGGPAPPPLSESLGIDFYSGFRKKSRYTLSWWLQRKKHKGGGCNWKS